MAYVRKGYPQRTADPTPEEIAAATAEIRESWTRTDYLQRAGLAVDVIDARERLGWLPPVVATAELVLDSSQ